VDAVLVNSGIAAKSIEAGTYFLKWGVIQISLTNFLIIFGMVILFVLALVVPFPGGAAKPDDEERGE
jgi:hypothetical protein